MRLSLAKSSKLKRRQMTNRTLKPAKSSFGAFQLWANFFNQLAPPILPIKRVSSNLSTRPQTANAKTSLSARAACPALHAARARANVRQSPPQNAQAKLAGPQVLKQTLPNGLTVLAQENRAAPVVAVRVYVRTGSIYEGKYLGAGLSHLFEHTLFEGTNDKDTHSAQRRVAGHRRPIQRLHFLRRDGLSHHDGQTVFRACRRRFSRHDAKLGFPRKRSYRFSRA